MPKFFKQFIAILIVKIIALLLTFTAIILYLNWSLPDVTPLKHTHPASTSFMNYRIQQAKEMNQKLKIRHRWVPLTQIPSIVQRTVILAEDASFWVHGGIDWYEIRESFLQNLQRGELFRGGSTITQQLAKNLYLTPEKSLSRKLKEWLLARRLERELSKRRILELYLNYAEFGKGIFGIGAAALEYFDKLPSQLNLWEAVRLAAILPNPHQLNPLRPTPALRWRVRVIISRLAFYGDISPQMEEELLAEYQSFFSH